MPEVGEILRADLLLLRVSLHCDPVNTRTHQARWDQWGKTGADSLDTPCGDEIE